MPMPKPGPLTRPGPARASPGRPRAWRGARPAVGLVWLLVAALTGQPAGAAPSAAAVSASPAPPIATTVPDTLAQRLQACTGCHGAQGRATAQGYFPRIAGKPADYLYRQLLNFREGRRQNATMAALLRPLSDDFLREIAQHFAGLHLPYPVPPAPTAPPPVLALGQRLVQQGDAARQLPACLQCHGATLTGVAPALPALLGLPQDYLVVQLGGWRTGQRRATAPDCMAQIAQRLSGDEVAAVAAWLAAQPVPADSRPAAAAPGPVPMPCGSGLAR